jgi:hypothetical protein
MTNDIAYQQFLAWFRSRWPEFEHPLDSAYECYLRGRRDEKVAQTDDEL